MKKIVTFTAAVFLAVSSTSVLAESKPITIAYTQFPIREAIAYIAGSLLQQAGHTVQYYSVDPTQWKNVDWTKSLGEEIDFLSYRESYLKPDNFDSENATDKSLRVGLAVHNSVLDGCKPEGRSKEISWETLQSDRCQDALITSESEGNINVSFPMGVRAEAGETWEKLGLTEPFIDIGADWPSHETYVKQLFERDKSPHATIVYAWIPSWMDKYFTFIKLPDSLNKKDIFSFNKYRAPQCSECAEEDIPQNMIRKQLKEDNPSAYIILNNVFLTGEQIAELDEWMQIYKMTPEEAAKTWVVMRWTYSQK